MDSSDDDLILELKRRREDPRRFIDVPEAFPHRVHAPLGLSDLQAAEDRLGFRLPALLRRLYLEVGNGGFGPGFGILALNERGAKNYYLPLVDCYLDAINPPHPDHPPWPRHYVTICDWGDSVTSVLDWTDPDAPVFRFNGDQYHDGPFERVIRLEAPSLRHWLKDWVAGARLFGRGRPQT